ALPRPSLRSARGRVRPPRSPEQRRIVGFQALSCGASGGGSNPGARKCCSQQPEVSMPIALVVVFWWVWFGASPAWAMLGGPVASVFTDQQALQAQRRTITYDGYEVESLEAANGIAVREYVSAGLVFGLAWEGPTMPDMAQLLGTYFSAYQDALHAAR